MQLVCFCRLVKEKLTKVVSAEEQLMFLLHLIGPFLHRFNTDRPKFVFDLTLELYTCLEQVDKNVPVLKYMDPISDLLYPLKYMIIYNVIPLSQSGCIKIFT